MLGKLEELVLISLTSVGPDAMAANIYEGIVDELGKFTTFGAVFTTIDRLVEKKFVTVKTQGPSPATNNRARKVYTISALGQRELRESLMMTLSLVERTGLALGFVGGVRLAVI